LGISEVLGHGNLVFVRTFGQHYLYYHAPNKKERLEMTWRSLGKAYDWELEKFRVKFVFINSIRCKKNTSTVAIRGGSLRISSGS
jgi:hypothetical protein